MLALQLFYKYLQIYCSLVHRLVTLLRFILTTQKLCVSTPAATCWLVVLARQVLLLTMALRFTTRELYTFSLTQQVTMTSSEDTTQQELTLQRLRLTATILICQMKGSKKT